MIRRYDPAGNKIGPDACTCSVIRFLGLEMWRVVRKCFLEEFAENCALVEGFVLVLERWDKTAGIQVEKRFRLVVGIDFNVLVLNAFFFK